MGTLVGAVIDAKSPRFIHRVSAIDCLMCGREVGMGAASQAMDVAERQSGPYPRVRDQHSAAYIVTCPACTQEMLVDERGQCVRLYP